MSNRLAGWCRVKAAAAMLAVIVALVSVSSAHAEEREGAHVLFSQQDSVQAFSISTGKGYQVGTATGAIAGTTFVDFQFIPTGPPAGDLLPFAFHNKVVITDINGDQIFFDNDGTGSFHLGVPGVDFQGSGGPLTGTYVVTGGTGKYHAFKVGSVYSYRGVATNPPSHPGGLGTVYVEVSRRDRDGNR